MLFFYNLNKKMKSFIIRSNHQGWVTLASACIQY